MNTDDALDVILSKHSRAILKFLFENGQANKTEIVRYSGAPSERTVSARIDDLETIGAISRTVGPHRASIYALTDRGQRVLTGIDAVATELEAVL